MNHPTRHMPNDPLPEPNAVAEVAAVLLSRRRFLARTAAVGLAGGALLRGGVNLANAAQPPVLPPSPGGNPPPDSDRPPAAPAAAEKGQPPKIPVQKAPTEQRSSLSAPLPPDQRVGFAVVGLGELSLSAVLPALCQTKKAKLTALVSGSPEKARTLAREYGVPERGLYNYQNFDTIRDNPDVQVVYVILPNSMHHEFVLRAAGAGKHVLCEKPMATNVRECEEMIAACQRADRKLMIAYRIQYEPHNHLMRKMVRDKTFGSVRMVEGVNGQNQGDPNQWRHKLALAGGGSLPDVGLYCLNTTRFLLGEEPTEVFATLTQPKDDPRFQEVEDVVTFQLRFPSGVLANLATGYSYHETRRYKVLAERGTFGLDPAFSYKGLRAQVSHANGAVEVREEPRVEEKDQFALEMDHMAECVRENQTPFTPGEEGLQDHRIMAAIYESAREGRVVKLAGTATPDKLDAFRGTLPASGKTL